MTTGLPFDHRYPHCLELSFLLLTELAFSVAVMPAEAEVFVAAAVAEKLGDVMSFAAVVSARIPRYHMMMLHLQTLWKCLLGSRNLQQPHVPCHHSGQRSHPFQ